MATRFEERPRERERAPEEAIQLEPMMADRDYEKLYGTRAWLRDRVRLAPVFAGVFIALSTEVFLTAFGIWVGVISAPVTPAGGLPTGLAFAVGAWIVASTWLATLLGSWFAARMAGVAGHMDGILNGVAVWGLFNFAAVILGSISTLFGIGSLVSVNLGAGTFDLLRALNLSSLATVTPDQAAAIRSFVSSVALFVWAGLAIGGGFAVLGGWLGARSRRVTVQRPQPQ